MSDQRQAFENGPELNRFKTPFYDPAREILPETKHAVDEAAANGGQLALEDARPAFQRPRGRISSCDGHQLDSSEFAAERSHKCFDMCCGAFGGRNSIERNVR